ncbi:hypothetical protein LR68_01682 [Anoxybacillus sp. BCO1]|nr:hypothetical protein LR68_01682 [Anoxybacillus sp. BCO1]
MKEQLPCIFLNPQTNTCFIYDVRPIPCRTYVTTVHRVYVRNHICLMNRLVMNFYYEFYIESLHDLIQTLIYEGEDVGIDYPDDLFTMDYLFCYFINEKK